MKQNQFFFVEVTDTFCGEANYSWVTRHKIKAKTQRGAVNKLSGIYAPEFSINPVKRLVA